MKITYQTRAPQGHRKTTVGGKSQKIGAKEQQPKRACGRTLGPFLLSVDEHETIAASDFAAFRANSASALDRCLQPTAQSVPLYPPGLPIVTIFTAYRRLMSIFPSPGARTLG